MKDARLEKKNALANYLREKKEGQRVEQQGYDRGRDAISDERYEKRAGIDADNVRERKRRNDIMDRSRLDERAIRGQERRDKTKLQADALERKLNPSHEQKIRTMGGEERKRLDSALMGVNAVKGMTGALAKGDNTFSIIGDNDFTMQRARLTEALGRMQSGGAINSDELAKFENMTPTMTDSAEIQKKKMEWLGEEMNKRVNNLGFQSQDFNDQAQQKTVTQKQFSPSRNQTKVTYSDGSTEMLDGKQ